MPDLPDRIRDELVSNLGHGLAWSDCALSKKTIRWVPAHTSIPGNETGDRATNEATGWREDSSRQLSADTPPRLYSIRLTVRR